MHFIIILMVTHDVLKTFKTSLVPINHENKFMHCLAFMRFPILMNIQLININVNCISKTLIFWGFEEYSTTILQVILENANIHN